MSIIARIRSLKAQHDFLKSVVAQEGRKSCPSVASLHTLKVKKLKIKEEIVRLTTK